MEKLLETSIKFNQTQIWNDSCSVNELTYSIARGSVGATTNPVIVLQVLESELEKWTPVIRNLIRKHPEFSEDEIAWELIKTMGLEASKLLLTIFNESNGKRGRLSLQTNAKFYRNSSRMLEHAKELSDIGPNTQIKAPASKAGIQAFEEMTYAGISINATVSFSVSQAIAVAEAVERGLERRKLEGLSIDTMNPVCTIMIGRLDDHLKREFSGNDDQYLEFAGIAVFKRAYEIYKKCQYRTTLLAAAFRNQHHWTELVGGDLILTIPYKWQLKYNSANVSIENLIDKPVRKDYFEKLMELDDFRKAYEIDGLSESEFESFGPFVATINQFLTGYDDLVKLIREYFFKK